MREVLEMHLTNVAFMFSQVGSVENFQGKEFNVTLVSTVRSTSKLTMQADQFTLGFVSNAKVKNITLPQ